MTAPRSIDAGIAWHLDHDANGSGMCAQHTWHSLGGDYGNPPPWGCSDANEVFDKVKAAGRYWTTPHRGDIALWKYGSNGHAARVYDNAGTKIATTNPSSDPNGSGTGVEPIGYPSRWGATTSARIFTDTYNLVKCFDSTGEDDEMPTAEQIAEAVWARKTEDPSTGDEVSMSELLRRTRTVATQGRDAAREAADNTG
jgi:hypothetical protein